jgi:ribosomal protein S27AE
MESLDSLTMSASRKERSASRFLVDLANLRLLEIVRAEAGAKQNREETIAAVRILLRKHRGFWPLIFPERSALKSLITAGYKEQKAAGFLIDELTEQEKKEASFAHVFHLAYELRQIWDEPDLQKREWGCIKLREKTYVRAMEGQEGQAPPNQPFDQAIKYLQYEVGSRAKRCQNPECGKPYFIARNKSYLHCPKCAPTQASVRKLKWWNENKPEILKKRKLQRRKKRGNLQTRR